MEDLISIIVPVYNVMPYLCQCIESIARQTYSALEIILVDDGSTDGCAQVCDEYAIKDSRIKVVHKENGGLVSARKAGLGAATGLYIGYVDGDDWIEPEMYGRMLGKMRGYGADVVICGRYEDTGNTQREIRQGVFEGYYDKQSMIRQVYPGMIVSGDSGGILANLWDKLYRRECIEKYQMAVDERLTMGEDAAAVYPCLLHADSIYVMGDCMYHYRQRAASMVRKNDGPEIERERFYILYSSVEQVLENGREIYDLTAQWREYLLYLMTPRADTLYKGIEKLDYLFPFPDVKRGSRVLIYGMGIYGQRLYRYLERTGFCNLVAAFDRNYAELEKQGVHVLPPREISDYEYDHIVIACMDKKAGEGIYGELVKAYPEEKIHAVDYELIRSDGALKAFGLLL